MLKQILWGVFAAAVMMAAEARAQSCSANSSASAVPCGANPTPVADGDLNGDQRADLVVGNLSEDTISVMINNGEGFDAPVVYAAGHMPWGVAIGDLNGDLKPDVVVANFGPLSSNLHVRFNNGDGTLGAPVTLTAGAQPITPLIVNVDVTDGDTDNDIVVTNFVGDSVSVFKNNGNGTFSNAVNYPTGDAPQGVAMGDINGDKRPDIVTCDVGADTISILLNTGEGTFAPRLARPTQRNEPYYCFIADFDADGHEDVAVTNYNAGGTGTVTIMRNLGAQAFQIFNVNVPNAPLGIDGADFEGDCDIDLVVSHYNSNVATVLFNLAPNVFHPSPVTTFGNGYGVVWSDVDSSGSPDIVVSMRLSDTVTVFKNDCWVIEHHPKDGVVCRGETTIHKVVGIDATSHTWRKDGIELTDGPTGTGSVITGSHTAELSIGPCGEADEGMYDCIVTSPCGVRTSRPGTLQVCSADFDCDGFVSGVDFDQYVLAFEAGETPADFDGDGFVTGIDYDLYVLSFEEGC